jgi:isoleucyl-tRNA synthetase
MQSEDMLFKDEEVKDVHNRLINILGNSLTFYELYADGTSSADGLKSTHVLDKWILTRLNAVIKDVTEAMEVYDLVRATRPLKDFVTELSTWYIRRSRDRFKGDDLEDKKYALGMTRHIFKEFSKLIAPIMPFIAEEIYGKVKEDGDRESVHLADWPRVEKSFFSFLSSGDSVLKDMAETRNLVSSALEQRSMANIKVRQPLSKLEVKDLKLPEAYLEILKDELNVKEVIGNKELPETISLDITLTPALLEEGKVRDAIRAVQEWRKEQGLKSGEIAQYTINNEQKVLFEKYAKEIKKATNIEFN